MEDVPALNVIEAGPSQAASVVFLHGLGVGAWSWNESMQALASERHVLAVDLPGCSASHQVPWSSLAATADAISAIVCARCRDGRADIVGHSLGGFTALVLLHRHPAVVRSTFITGVTAEPFRPRWLWALAVPVLAALVASSLWAQAMARMLGLDPEERARFVADAKHLRAATARVIYREVVEFRLPPLPRVPLLVAAGGREGARVQRALDVIRAGHPDSSTLVVPDSGHMWLAERPAFFLSVLRAFLDGRPLPAAPEAPAVTPTSRS